MRGGVHHLCVLHTDVLGIVCLWACSSRGGPGMPSACAPLGARSHVLHVCMGLAVTMAVPHLCVQARMCTASREEMFKNGVVSPELTGTISKVQRRQERPQLLNYPGGNGPTLC